MLSPLKGKRRQICPTLLLKCRCARLESSRSLMELRYFVHDRQSAPVAVRAPIPQVQTWHRALVCAKTDSAYPAFAFEAEKLDCRSLKRESTLRYGRLPIKQRSHHRPEDNSGLQCQYLYRYSGRPTEPHRMFRQVRFPFVYFVRPATLKTLRTHLHLHLYCPSRRNGCIAAY